MITSFPFWAGFLAALTLVLVSLVNLYQSFEIAELRARVVALEARAHP